MVDRVRNENFFNLPIVNKQCNEDIYVDGGRIFFRKAAKTACARTLKIYLTGVEIIHAHVLLGSSTVHICEHYRLVASLVSSVQDLVRWRVAGMRIICKAVVRKQMQVLIWAAGCSSLTS